MACVDIEDAGPHRRPPQSARTHLLALRVSVGLAAVLLTPREASALQPLSEFLRSAETRNFDALEQTTVVAQREQEASQSWWKLAPVVTASGAYTRNQYAAIATIPVGASGQTISATIVAQDQLDATFSATLPIVDVGAWEPTWSASAARP